MKFRFLEHTADIKFKAWGRTKEKAFESSVLAFSSYVARGQKINPVKKKALKIEGRDSESLLYRLMDELIYLVDSDNFIVSKAEIKIKGNKLEAVLFGDDVKKYKGLDHVKAATYAEMHINQLKGGIWEAQVVLDV